jgi:hypothetical protein
MKGDVCAECPLWVKAVIPHPCSSTRPAWNGGSPISPMTSLGLAAVLMGWLSSVLFRRPV